MGCGSALGLHLGMPRHPFALVRKLSAVHCVRGVLRPLLVPSLQVGERMQRSGLGEEMVEADDDVAKARADAGKDGYQGKGGADLGFGGG